MVAFAERQFSLGKTNSQGVTVRALLEDVERTTGRRPPELEMPEINPYSLYIWDIFMDIHSGRTYGMAGPNPLTWTDILAWCNLNETMLSAWEVGVVKALDLAWIRETNRGEK